MKRRIMLILLILLFPVLVFSARFEISQISAVKTADALIITGAAVFDGLIVQTDGSNNVTFTIYDNTSATGTKITPTSLTVTGSSQSWALSYDPPVGCSTGIYVDITTAGTVAYQVLYRQVGGF